VHIPRVRADPGITKEGEVNGGDPEQTQKSQRDRSPRLRKAADNKEETKVEGILSNRDRTPYKRGERISERGENKKNGVTCSERERLEGKEKILNGVAKERE